MVGWTMTPALTFFLGPAGQVGEVLGQREVDALRKVTNQKVRRFSFAEIRDQHEVDTLYQHTTENAPGWLAMTVKL